jgi:hypothetical protein
MKRISLTRELFALVDDADFDWISQWKWYAAKNHNTWYAERSQRTRAADGSFVFVHFLMHRVILGVASGVKVDHEDRYGLNNQRGNLRPATTSQNAMNRVRRRGGSSRFKGVTWRPRQRQWEAAIRCGSVGEGGSERRYLGLFRNEEDAARAYDTAAAASFGEFARLNFPVKEAPIHTDEPESCDDCGGSGEGARPEMRCPTCGGSGDAPRDDDREPDDPESFYEMRHATCPYDE